MGQHMSRSKRKKKLDRMTQDEMFDYMSEELRKCVQDELADLKLQIKAIDKNQKDQLFHIVHLENEIKRLRHASMTVDG